MTETSRASVLYSAPALEIEARHGDTTVLDAEITQLLPALERSKHGQVVVSLAAAASKLSLFCPSTFMCGGQMHSSGWAQ